MIKQDDTGKMVLNGTVAKFIEKMRWWGGALLIPMVMALGGWIIKVEVFHQEVISFMEYGPRFTGSGEFDSAAELYRQLLLDIKAEMAAHEASGPHAGVPERLDALDTRLDNIQATQLEILRELRR